MRGVEELREMLGVKVFFLSFFLYLCLSLFNVSSVVLVLSTLCSVLRVNLGFLSFCWVCFPARVVASPCWHPGWCRLSVQRGGGSAGRGAGDRAQLCEVCCPYE